MGDSQRLDHIDGLRGIAALVVVFQHAMQMVHNAGHSIFDFLLFNINLGRFGVVLFFLISGCVVPFSFKGDRPLRNFALSRFFRLYPAYWLSIPVLAILTHSQGEAVTPGMMLSNISMIQGFWGGSNIGRGYWTLSYEMAFYILCAFLFWRNWLNDAGLVTAIATAMIAAMLWSVATEVYWQTPYFIALFLLGTVLRQALVDGDPRAKRCAGWLAGFTIAAGAFLSWKIPFVASDAGGARYFTPMALGTSMTLPIVLFAAVLRCRPNMSRLAIWLGSVSYSVYLFQDVGLYLLPRVIEPQSYPFLYVALVLSMTIAIAALVYRFVEQPMVALGRRATHGKRKPEQALAARAA